MGNKLLILVLVILPVGLIGLGIFIGYSQVFGMAAPARGHVQTSAQAKAQTTGAKPAAG
ncbi:MAG: hypothetical protein ACYCSR_07875 [Thiomonas sp.]|uniref:Uncharacterized protein n=1 Tax=mine drainage metagenome TaxID=410659 RepID=E6PW52_9ZZZZ